MNVLSVCDGIGAAHVAWHDLGWRPYVLSEIEAFPRAVLKHRHGAKDARQSGAGDAPLLWGDFTTLRERFLRRFGRSFADVYLLAGGTPCQAFSVAGNRLSLADARGNLTLAFVGLANAIDASRCRAQRAAAWIVWENVPGVFSTSDNAFGSFLGALCGSGSTITPPRNGKWDDAGVVAGPSRCASWRILDAQHFGLAQRRRRILIVARGYFGGAGEWDGPDALLPLIESSRWHNSPRRHEGQDIAPTLSARTRGGGGLGTDFEIDGGLVPLNSLDGVSHALTSNHSRRGGLDPESETFIGIAPTLCAAAGSTRLAVRRLTPRECERLQGFPDDYTLIPFRNGMATDGPRYKALGNSWAVPKLRYVGERIAEINAKSLQVRGAA